MKKYYIDKTHVQATDTGNVYGTSDRPRLTDTQSYTKRVTMPFLVIVVFLICLIPVLAQSATRSMTVEWEMPAPVPTDLAGFNLYLEGTKVTTISDPAARTYTGEIEYRDEKVCYTMTAFDKGGGESPHSPCFDVDIPPGAPGNVRVTVVVDVKVIQD